METLDKDKLLDWIEAKQTQSIGKSGDYHSGKADALESVIREIEKGTFNTNSAN